MKGMLTIFVLVLFIADTACKQSSVQKPAKEQSPTPLPSTQVTIQEPLFENSPVGFRRAWREFSKKGNTEWPKRMKL
jgi:hypothetical protein